MLGEIFKALLITSFAGSCLAAVITLIKPLTKKVFGYAWHYYIWLAVLAVMLLPVRFPLSQEAGPSALTVRTAQAAENVQASDMAENAKTAIATVQAEPERNPWQAGASLVKGVIDSRLNLAACLWLTGAGTLLFINLMGYVRLIVKMRKNSVVAFCPRIADFTRRKITARVWENTSSPFMVGIVRHTLVLPARALTQEQLNNILRHEMTHFKRHDILYQWFVLLVKCLHWFNPVIWYVARQIHTECEISCDMAVTLSMSKDEEMRYIDTILSLLPRGKAKQILLTTQMASSKKALKRRFEMIRNKRRTSKFVSALSAVLAAVMLSTTVFASGALSDLTTDDYTVEITNNGKKIELVNKPFIENGKVYVPLRETMEKAGFRQNNSNIVWDNGKIYVAIAQNGAAGFYVMEIGQAYMGLEHIQPSGIYHTSLSTAEPIMSKVMNHVPVLRNSNTYIPIKDINYMLYGFFNVRNKDNSLHELSYNVYDKNGNIITTSSLENDRNKRGEYEKEKLPFGTAELFFRDFYRQDFENMKTYCTENCVKNFFEKTLDGYQVFGMKGASVRSITYANGSSETSDKAVLEISLYWIEFEETSVYAQNRSPVSFYMILQRQSDGRYFIDEFAAGL